MHYLSLAGVQLTHLESRSDNRNSVVIDCDRHASAEKICWSNFLDCLAVEHRPPVALDVERPSFFVCRCTVPVHWNRTAASALITGLAPENFAWLAQYFLGQLVGWGLAPPEETDSEVMALVAPAGDKGRATLQKLHRRISTPSFGEVSGLTRTGVL